MRPDDTDLDDELRGHLAIAVQERVERGEDPKAARLAALRELGYVPEVRESMRRVWYGQAWDALTSFGQEMRIAARALRRARGLAVAVIATLALGIGADAAIFSVLSAVLLRPLVNRGEDRLVYIRQSAPGIGSANTTFSVPEVRDLQSRARTVEAFGEFSTIDLTLIGLGQPRIVIAGVVSGQYFDVMGLRPVLGRLLTPDDDGPDAAPAVVLTHRFWTEVAGSDTAVIGKTIRLSRKSAIVVGVLEPSVPYPATTEILANIVTSPHHLGATMVTSRTHRMTELFARIRPGVTLAEVRKDLAAAHDVMLCEHPAAYPDTADVRLSVTPLREQITAPARTILFLLVASAVVVFVIACANVANLILARSVGREGELTIRAALGASHGALRRTLLAESLVLCAAGAGLGLLIARPLVAVVASFVSRFSVRALEVSVDANLLWIGGALALVAAVVLAYVPRLPGMREAGASPHAREAKASPHVRGRLRVFATAQIALSFVLLALAGTLVTTLISLGTSPSVFSLRQVLAFDLPMPSLTNLEAKDLAFYDEVTRRLKALPGVEGAALGNFVPWRDAGMLPRFQVGDPDRASGNSPHARLRIAGAGYFSVVGVRLVAGREFTAADGSESEPVAIISVSLAARLFEGDAVGRSISWRDPLFTTRRWRVVGVVADADDENVVQSPALTVYHPVNQLRAAGRLFVRTSRDPYAVAPAVAATVRALSPEQPIERAATLGDIRAQVLAPERLNAMVLGGFAVIALLIAVVGVAGVLAFGVSARTHEFGVRLAVGSSPRELLAGVLREGLGIVLVGIAAGVAGAWLSVLVARGYVDGLGMPGTLPIATATAALVVAALAASLVPAARAARVDVLQALRAE